MPDITMCEGYDCPWKTKCHRFTAKPSNYRQAYFIDFPGKMVEELFTCDFFWGEKSDRIYQDLKDICKG